MINVTIDVSHHQASVDFARLRAAGIVAVIAKATQGVSYVDPCYHARRTEALAQSILWGAYHFGEPGNVAAQVAHFLDTVQPTASDLLVLDWEDSGGLAMTVREAEAFVERVALETHGRWPGLYSGQSFLQEQLGTTTVSPLGTCFLWIARYSRQQPVVPPLWDCWSFWQYSDQGRVPGVQGPCDRSRFNGELEQLYRLWGVPMPGGGSV